LFIKYIVNIEIFKIEMEKSVSMGFYQIQKINEVVIGSIEEFRMKWNYIIYKFLEILILIYKKVNNHVHILYFYLKTKYN
jgi:hypothetical protein